MANLYCIHDPWFFGLKDGDMDDRAAFKYYEKYLNDNGGAIVVYIPGPRYDVAMKYFKDSPISFHNEFIKEIAEASDKISICAPVEDPIVRNKLAQIIRKKQNGYCQGNKIGSTNFPSVNYSELLESIPNHNRYDTVSTNIQFHHSLLDILDPEYKQEYMAYGILKLISPAGILHVPGLLYRLYCPILGGGPGTNMLKIQEILQTHFGLLPQVKITAESFQVFNSLLIDQECLVISDNIKKITENAPKELVDSLIVMVYFANLVFVKKDGSPLYEKNDICSLNTIPEGTLKIQLTETPPLYDFVVAFCVLNDIGSRELVDNFETMTRILKGFV